MLICVVIAADGLYKRDVFRKNDLSLTSEYQLTTIDRFPGSICCCNDQWRADEDHTSHKENIESILGRDL